jgi:hypothetical protein
MVAAAPTPTPVPPSTPSPTAPPAAKPAVPPAAVPPPKPPRKGTVDDRGVARHDSIHAVHWTGHGQLKVQAEVDADSIELVGSVSVGGSLTADSVRSEGDLEVVGAMTVTGRLFSSGDFRTRGPVHLGEAELRGRAHLDAPLQVDRLLEVSGQFLAPSIRAGAFSLDGVAQVPGSVEADRVQARFRSAGHLGPIRAGSVVLSVRPPNPIEMVLGRNLAVKIPRIEADTVDLEGVDVQFVRAREITLGRDAHVTELEGTVVRRHKSARVGPESRSPPPHGLSR